MVTLTQHHHKIPQGKAFQILKNHIFATHSLKILHATFILLLILTRFLKACCSVANLGLTVCDTMNCSTTRHPCPSLSPRVFSDSCPLSQWYPPIISPFVSSTSFSTFCLSLLLRSPGRPMSPTNWCCGLSALTWSCTSDIISLLTLTHLVSLE